MTKLGFSTLRVILVSGVLLCCGVLCSAQQRGNSESLGLSGGDVTTPSVQENAKKAIEQSSWNVFRYIGDFCHLAAMFALLAQLMFRGSAKSVSLKTQILYFCVYSARYCDATSAHSSASFYLTAFKAVYILLSGLSCALLATRLRSSYQQHADSVSLWPFVAIPSVVAGLVIFMRRVFTWRTFMWVASEALESTAMIPQYIMMYRLKEPLFQRDCFGVSLFVILIGFYRTMYVVNWIYKRASFGQLYVDWPSWLSGGVEFVLFVDFLKFSVFGGMSWLETSWLLCGRFAGCLWPSRSLEMSSVTRLSNGDTYGAIHVKRKRSMDGLPEGADDTLLI